MGTAEVIQYSPSTWRAMKLYKNSLRFYEEDGSAQYQDAIRKEKAVLRELIKDRT